MTSHPSTIISLNELFICKMLEDGRGVGETKEHDCRFKEAFVGDQGSLPLVSVFDMNIVISPLYIKFGENPDISFINEIGDKGKGIGVVNGVFIEVLIVLAGVEVSILLFDKEEGVGLGRVERADFARFKIFIEEVFCDFPFIGREGIDFPNLRDEGFVKVYFMVIRLGWKYMVSGFFGEGRDEFSIFRG